MRDLWLVRHLPVCASIAGRCYGRTDVALAPGVLDAASELIAQLRAFEPTLVLHSNLSRARLLAERITTDSIGDDRLAEMNFGEWEEQPWTDIHTQYPGAMDRLLSEPETFAPPGGETPFAVRNRVVEWYESLPKSGRILAVAHGGTIAALRAALRNEPISRWVVLIPKHGEIVQIDSVVSV